MKRLLLLLLAPLLVSSQYAGHCPKGQKYVCEEKWDWFFFKKIPYCECKDA